MFTHTPYSAPRARNANTESSGQFSELYFSYSSNMSPETMKGRYPNSLFCGLAKLSGWRWNINSTEYANIIPASEEDVVYGALYFITGSDEEDLDVGEGVPDHYDKQWIEVTRINADGSETEQKVTALMYIDSQRPDEGTIKPDYVVWIRKAIRDAKP